MFARALELTLKVEKKQELIRKAKADILPILHKQQGFADILALENEIELTKVLVITLWHTKLDAERYARDMFPKIKEMFEPFLMVPPGVKVYTVEETISRKLIETVAA
ncbi:MAG TPA: hypothetical protein VGF08_12015 [Terriglobales bacterium]|jgi:hypothetical protein